MLPTLSLHQTHHLLPILPFFSTCSSENILNLSILHLEILRNIRLANFGSEEHLILFAGLRSFTGLIHSQVSFVHGHRSSMGVVWPWVLFSHGFCSVIGLFCHWWCSAKGAVPPQGIRGCSSITWSHLGPLRTPPPPLVIESDLLTNPLSLPPLFVRYLN